MRYADCVIVMQILKVYVGMSTALFCRYRALERLFGLFTLHTGYFNITYTVFLYHDTLENTSETQQNNNTTLMLIKCSTRIAMVYYTYIIIVSVVVSLCTC